MSQVSYPTIINLTIAAGSLSDGWCMFKKYYVAQVAADNKARFTQSWYSP